MGPYRLRAPTGDGEVVSWPPLDDAAGVLEANRARIRTLELDLQGRSLQRLRQEARAELRARSARFHQRFGLAASDWVDDDRPIVVTGHQPELFHPGVWAKNFAAARLAGQVGGAALNLDVDNDVPRSAHVRVPVEQAGEIRTVLIEYDRRREESPFEEWSVHDETLFASFADRVRAVLHPAIRDPLIDVFWPKAIEASRLTDRLGLRFVAARHTIETSWGARNAELPISQACETDAFLWFVSHVLAHLPRFQEVHNACLGAYRRRYGIRSHHHPVAELHEDGSWQEAPFWAWRARAPRRRALYARRRGRELDLRIAGENEPFLTLPLAPDREACCAVERLRELPALGIRLRPRALTTTMFARLLVGDLFIHGIGGAKYDELGDAIVRRFHGIEPPRFLAFSMTVWPGLPIAEATEEDLRRARARRRGMIFQPERFLEPPLSPEVAAAVDTKSRFIQGPVETRRERVARYFGIREVNQRLVNALQEPLSRLDSEIETLQHAVWRNQIAKGREFAFILHSERRLRERLRSVLPETTRR